MESSNPTPSEHQRLIRCYDYQHGGARTARRWCYYVSVWGIATFSLTLLALQYVAYLSVSQKSWAFVIAALASVFVASLMIVRVRSTRTVRIEEGCLVMPHFLNPIVAHPAISSVHVDRPSKGMVLIGVDGQIPRQLDISALQPPVSPQEFAQALTGAIGAASSDRRLRQLVVAEALATQSLKFPVITLTLAGTLVLIHAFAWYAGSRFDALDLIASGASFGPFPLFDDLLRAIDAVLLHADWKHLSTNILMLVFAGIALERVVQWRTFTTTFIVGGLVAVLVSKIVLATALQVGASGGICALLGLHMYIVVVRPFPVPATISGLPSWLLVPVTLLGLGVLLPGVDWLAHLVGLIVGLLLGRFLYSGASRRSASTTRSDAAVAQVPRIAAGCAVVLLITGAVDVAIRINNLNDGGRLAAIQQTMRSQASTEIVAELLWLGVVLPRENLEVVSAGIRRLQTDPAAPITARAVLAALQFLDGNYSAAYAQQKRSLLEARSQDKDLKSRLAARLVQFGASAALQTRRQSASVPQCLEVVSVLERGKQPRAIEVAYDMIERHTVEEEHTQRTVLSIENAEDCSARPMRVEIAPQDWRRTQELFPLKVTQRRAFATSSGDANTDAASRPAAPSRH